MAKRVERMIECVNALEWLRTDCRWWNVMDCFFRIERLMSESARDGMRVTRWAVESWTAGFFPLPELNWWMWKVEGLVTGTVRSQIIVILFDVIWSSFDKSRSYNPFCQWWMVQSELTCPQLPSHPKSLILTSSQRCSILLRSVCLVSLPSTSLKL